MLISLQMGIKKRVQRLVTVATAPVLIKNRLLITDKFASTKYLNDAGPDVRYNPRKTDCK